MNLVMLGLSITSSWGNGHATTFRGLLREWRARGHHALFLERDVPWYAENRDMPQPDFCDCELYNNLADLENYRDQIRNADCVIVGSYIPDGIQVGEWVLENAKGLTAFYDIDTPVTLAALQQDNCAYLAPDQIGRYDYYFSFAGGAALKILRERYHSPNAVPLYCSVDTSSYYPEPYEKRWDLGYMGTYSEDRQPALERLLLEPARLMPNRVFCIAGPQYLSQEQWPMNVNYLAHVPPSEHRAWYNSQQFTLNITRADMIALGHSPSVRLFEAAACGVPIISDYWTGLEEFFVPGEEILIAENSQQVQDYLTIFSDAQRVEIGQRARARVLAAHTAAHRAAELEYTLFHRTGCLVS